MPRARVLGPAAGQERSSWPALRPRCPWGPLRAWVGCSPVWWGHGHLRILASLPLWLWGAESPAGLPVPRTWMTRVRLRPPSQPGAGWCARTGLGQPGQTPVAPSQRRCSPVRPVRSHRKRQRAESVRRKGQGSASHVGKRIFGSPRRLRSGQATELPLTRHKTPHHSHL